jgi:hypothetical protein
MKAIAPNNNRGADNNRNGWGVVVGVVRSGVGAVIVTAVVGTVIVGRRQQSAQLLTSDPRSYHVPGPISDLDACVCCVTTCTHSLNDLAAEEIIISLLPLRSLRTPLFQYVHL